MYTTFPLSFSKCTYRKQSRLERIQRNSPLTPALTTTARDETQALPLPSLCHILCTRAGASRSFSREQLSTALCEEGPFDDRSSRESSVK